MTNRLIPLDATIAALEAWLPTTEERETPWAALNIVRAVDVVPSPQNVAWQDVHTIAGCTLHGIPVLDDEGEEIGETGRWVEVTCREYQACMVGAGGYDALTVFGSMTGEFENYTCWGLKDRVTPVCAVGGPVNDNRDCVGQVHAIFIPERTA